MEFLGFDKRSCRKDGKALHKSGLYGSSREKVTHAKHMDLDGMQRGKCSVSYVEQDLTKRLDEVKIELLKL